MPTLHWVGKEKVINHHQDVPFRVLEEQYTYGGEKSENKIIHGDNLEALKSLLPEYEGKIKCIYIDPPYNTGNEGWVYNDNVKDPKIQKWLGEVVGKESEDLSRHDKWLCMMYPRLKLLHKLLADDGVIFVSISFKYEQAHLRLMLDEIFGFNNYIGVLTWESTTQPINSGSAKFGLQQKVEPIMFFAKNKQLMTEFIFNTESGENRYPHQGVFGKCRFEIIEKSDKGGYQRDTMKFEILGHKPREGKRWQIGYETATELLRMQRLEVVDGIVKRAIYPEDEVDKKKINPFWSHFTSTIVGTAQNGKDTLAQVLGYSPGFDTVKPVKIIEKIINYLPADAIILDSFAGSGTTAHAVLNLNKQDGGNRKFILVEMMDYAETITAERVRRVIDGYGEGTKVVEGTGGDFSYYTLGESVFLPDGSINRSVPASEIRKYVYFMETKQSIRENNDSSYLLGVHNDVAYYFCYDADKEVTLNHQLLSTLTEKATTYIIYADICILSDAELDKYNIAFKKIPRDIIRL